MIKKLLLEYLFILQNYLELLRTIKKYYESCYYDNGRIPSYEEVAENLNIKEEEVHRLLNLSLGVISLDTPIGEEEDTSLVELIPYSDGIEENVAEILYNSDIIKIMHKHLRDRECLVLEMRFGLIDGFSHTLEEIGKEIGVTRERVRQIESKALKRLRYILIMNKTREKQNRYKV